MNKFFLTLILLTNACAIFPFCGEAKDTRPDLLQQVITRPISGQVLHGNEPLHGATVLLKELNLLEVTNSKGEFVFSTVPQGDFTLIVRYTGMQNQEIKVKSSEEVLVRLVENSIAIADVQVVGKASQVKGATSTSISRQAIEHLQATHLGEILQLLPGETIGNPSFAGVNSPSIRQISESGSKNVASLGTSIIINGAQLSNNANLQAANTAQSGVLSSFSTSSGMGTDLRQISADNIESVEVIRGIPSVEYGDLTSGIIDVKTKAGVEPLQAKFRLNPTLRQAWVGQGFSLGENAGALFVDVDYTHAADKQILTSESYQRINTSMQYTTTFGGNNQVYSNSTFSFGGYFDDSKIDPDLIIEQRINRAENYDFRFSTNGRWKVDKRFARNLNYTLSAQYGMQQGYQQLVNTGDVTAISTSLQDATMEVPYLPSTYMQRIWIEGNPLNVQAKISDNFYFSTGNVQHGIMVGGQYALDKNFGKGKYFDESKPPKTTSNIGFRPREFSAIPALQQLSFYIEDKVNAKLFNRDLQVVAGLRFDQIQPFRRDQKNAFSPRINASYELVNNLTIRGGYGLSAKAPTLIYLYPEQAYVDVFSLNHYKENPNESLALMTTRIFSTSNPDLEIAKSKKAELGLDYVFANKRRVAVMVYDEQTKNGYDMYEYYNFANIPIYTVQSQLPGEKPVLNDEVENSLYVVDYTQPSNTVNVTNRGIEVDADFGRIAAINTSFTLGGAYVYTKRMSNEPLVYGRRVSGEEYNRLGVFEVRGRAYERLVSTLRAIHHVPALRLIVSLTAQTIWQDKDRFINYTNRPYGVINITENGAGQVHPLSPQEIAAISESSGIYLSYDETYRIERSWQPLWLFNMKLTKEFGQNFGFSFYVNNVTNNRPLQSNTRNPNEFTKRNIPIYFGSELTFKF